MLVRGVPGVEDLAEGAVALAEKSQEQGERHQGIRRKVLLAGAVPETTAGTAAQQCVVLTHGAFHLR